MPPAVQDSLRTNGTKMASACGPAFSHAIEQNRLFADAYFSRGACHYAMRHYQQAREDLNAAALFGCRVAQLWSRFEIKMPDEPEEVDAPDL